MDDYITISDDEDIEITDYIVHLDSKPVPIIDLTKGDQSSQIPDSNINLSNDRSQPNQQREESVETDESVETEESVKEDEPVDREEFARTEGPVKSEEHVETEQPVEAEVQENHPPRADLEQEHQQNSHPLQPEQQRPKTPPPIMSDHDLMMKQKELGNEKYKRNMFDDAVRTYKRANELAKKLGNKEMSAILHFNLAMTYFKLHSFDQAADECANAVKLNDNYIKAHLKRAEIYTRQRKFDEAVICYEHICELDNKNSDFAILLNSAKEAAKRVRKRDYYEILGLTSNFSREDLRKAYRQQALNHHPDRHSDADIVTRRIQEKRFKDASEAHSFIQHRFGSNR